MIQFAIEPLRDAWPDLVRMAAECWRESEKDRHSSKFDMRFERYLEYEEAGIVYCAVARDKGVAVGFAMGHIMDSLQTQAKICLDDGLYLAPSHRTPKVAVRLMRFAEDFCREQGVTEMLFHAQPGGSAARILEFLDYAPITVQYFKRLSRADSAYPSLAVMETSSNEHGRLPESS